MEEAGKIGAVDAEDILDHCGEAVSDGSENRGRGTLRCNGLRRGKRVMGRENGRVLHCRMHCTSPSRQCEAQT